MLLLAAVAPEHSAPQLRAPVAVSGELHGRFSGGYSVTFLAPALNGSGKNYSFELDGIAFDNETGGSATTVTSLAEGPHVISNITAGPADPGWAYEASASTGSVFSEPGTSEVLLTFAYVNLSAPRITLTFQQTQLGPLTSWSITFNGTNRNSHGSQITFSGQPGYYERAYHTALNAQGQVQYRIDQNLSFLYYSKTATIPLVFDVYFQLGVYGGPGGSVKPNGISWVPHNGTAALYAVGSLAYSFKSWTGVGLGNYTGEAPQHNISVGGPITEFAVFLPRANNSAVVRFTEVGLPNGTIWTVVIGGVGYSSGVSVLAISGLIACTTNLSTDPGNYSVTLPDIYKNQTIPGLSDRYVAIAPPTYVCGNGAPVTVTFTPQYLVLGDWSAGGSVSATVNGSTVLDTFVAPGSSVRFQASPSFGYQFDGWSGMGAGAYNGSPSVVTVVVIGSLEEVAAFSAGPQLLANGYPVTFQVSSGIVVAPVWTISLDGQAYAANGSQLMVPDVSNGSHAVVVPNVIGPSSDRRSVPTSPSFALTVTGPTLVNLTYTTQFWLAVSVFGPGTVTPGSGWIIAGAVVALQGTPAPGASLLGWSSTSPGGFSGNNTSAATLQVAGPISEVAVFGPGPTPADFWHRSNNLIAAAVGGLLLGFVVVAFLFYVRRRRRPSGPPPGASLPGRVPRPGGEVSARPAKASGGVPPKSAAAPAVLLLVLLIAMPALSFLVGHPASLAAPPIPRDELASASRAVPATEGTALAAAGSPGDTSVGPDSRLGPGPSAGGPTLTFHETNLPAGLNWTVSVWPFDTGINTPLTKSSTSPNLAFPLSATEFSVDYDVWTVYDPASPTTLLVGTPNVTGPIDPNVNSSIGVSFSVMNPTALSFRFHLVAFGLPAGQPWQASVEGVEYNFSQPATDVYFAHGSSFTFGATSVVFSPDVEYVPTLFAIERFNGSGPWSNSTSSPIVRVANASFWIGVEYTTYYRVRVLGDLGGVVTPPTGWYPQANVIVATATPQTGFQFVNWSGIGVGSVSSNNSVIHLAPYSGIEEIASFVAIPYDIDVVETGIPQGESYSFVYNGAIYNSNQSTLALPTEYVGNVNVSVPDIPSSQTIGERFVPISITSTFPAGTNATFYIDGNGTIFLTFATQYALTIATSGPGTTDPGAGSYWEPAGATIAVRGFPASPNLALEEWRGTGNGSYTGSASGILVTMRTPIGEDAQFGPPFPPTGDLLSVVEIGLPSGTTWSAAAGSLGAAGATPTLLIGPLAPGAVTVTVAPVPLTPGERFSPEGGGTFRFGLNGNSTLSVVFTAEFALNVSVQFGGSVAAYPRWVAANESVTLLAEPPAPGYRFNGWNGTSNATAALLTLTATGPIVLTAQFGPLPPTGSSGPKDLAIAAADVGIPAAVGAIAAFLWYRRRR